MSTILLVDDHVVVRRGLKEILQEELPDAAFLEASDAQEALRTVAGDGIDLVVLDISLPGRSGLDILKEIKYAETHASVLVLSMHPEDHYAVRALKAGASGYLTKQSAPEELGKAVRKILAGGTYISQQTAEKLASDLSRAPAESPHETLSDREYEVMRLIAKGMTVSEIAELLSLSVKTISTYRYRLLKKMEMRTNSQVTAYAVRQHLVD